MQNIDMVRHGDIGIVNKKKAKEAYQTATDKETRQHWKNIVEGFDEPKTPVKNNVVEEGEATGHLHQITGKGTVNSTESGVRYVDPQGKSSIVHQQHGPIELISLEELATYRQREYNPYEKAIRYVQD